jgi:hypothetical protein
MCGLWAAFWPSYWQENQSLKEESKHDLPYVFILPITDGVRSMQLRRSIESNLALSRDALRGHPPSRWFTEGQSSPKVAGSLINLQKSYRLKTTFGLCPSNREYRSRNCSHMRTLSLSTCSPRCSTLIPRSELHAIKRWSTHISPFGMIRRTNPSAQLCVDPYIDGGSSDVTLLAEIRLFFRRGRLDRWDEEAHRR